MIHNEYEIIASGKKLSKNIMFSKTQKNIVLNY